MHDLRPTDLFEVVEAKHYVRDDGKTASPFGSNPWTSEEERARWSLVTDGYAVRNLRTGTRGIGRMPWKTREEAQAWIDARAERMREQARQERERRIVQALTELLAESRSDTQGARLAREALSFKDGKQETPIRCECHDPACLCEGKCQSIETTSLVRIDLADRSPLCFCLVCAEDAAESGLFADAEDQESEEA